VIAKTYILRNHVFIMALGEAKALKRNSIGFFAFIVLTFTGLAAYIAPIEVSPFFTYAGAAALWPIILGFVLFALVSLPILEYSRIAPFAGGYYGLSELGFGRVSGKFTALVNYSFYNFIQVANGFFIGWLVVDTIDLIYGVLVSFWIWVLVTIVALLVTYLVGSLSAKNLGRLLTVAGTTMAVIVIAFSLYVIIKSPYNSAYYFNPANSSAGFGGIATATAVVGFFLFAGYGIALFFSEEGVQPRKNVWKAIYGGLIVATLIIGIVTYSMLVAVPRGELAAVGTSALPQLVTWIRYIPTPVLVGLNFLIAIIAMLGFGSQTGSQARILYSLGRDDFIKNNWVKKLNPKSSIPSRAVLVNLILALVSMLLVMAIFIHIYGYNPNSIAVAWFVSGTISTLFWFLHHFIPEVGLYPFIRKHRKYIKFSTGRIIVSSLIVPIVATAMFIYIFYLGIVSDLVEPYFGALIGVVILTFVLLGYVIFKYYRHTIGSSAVSDIAKEFIEQGSKEDDS